MKDFLQGRPSVASTRGVATPVQLPSNLPPISQPASFQELSTTDSGVGNFGMEITDNPNGSASCDTEPQVEIVPDAEGRVGHIVVTCRCGEKITLQCNY